MRWQVIQLSVWKRRYGVVVAAVTCQHELRGSVHRLPLRPLLATGLQILQDIDIWCKVDHVLLPAAIRHLDQRVQAADGRAEEVSCRSISKEEEEEEENI